MAASMTTMRQGALGFKGNRTTAGRIAQPQRFASIIRPASIDPQKANTEPSVKEKSDQNPVEKALLNNYKWDNPTEGVKDQQNQGAPGSIPVSEAMAANGPAPERINGRLAMVGFVTAVAAELVTGKSVLSQIQSAPLPIIGVFVIVIVASLIPIKRGEDLKRSSGPLTPQREIWNGRWAMMGFLALLATEGIKGGALF